MSEAFNHWTISLIKSMNTYFNIVTGLAPKTIIILNSLKYTVQVM